MASARSTPHAKPDGNSAAHFRGSKGISNLVAREVGAAVHRLECGPQTAAAGAQVYRFTVAFMPPETAAAGTQAASPTGGTRVAVLSR